MADEATATEAAAETSGDSTETAAATEATTTETPAAGEAALGDAGKKALDAMKAERKAARDEAAAAKAERDALQAKLDGKEAEHAAAQEAQRLRDEALAVANERILKAEVRAAAASKLNDPQDALRFLNLSEFEVGSDGEVDASQVAQAIDDLIASKPYLAAQGKRFQGTADGGARNGTAEPSQLTKADLARMTPEQIDAAITEGRATNLLSGK
jgi:hypothetical protein